MKSSCWTILLLGMVLLAGCGSQDRYEVMDPQGNYIVEDTPWATLTQLPTIYNNSNPSNAAVIDGQLIFGAYGGLVYGVTSTGFEILPSPGQMNIMDLLAGPDGMLWMTDNYGKVYFLQGESWELEIDLELSKDFHTSLFLDDQNRLLLMGDKRDPYWRGDIRSLWRRETNGQWVKQILPGEPDLADGWCEHGMPPVFLSRNLEVITEGPDGWEVSESLDEDVDEDHVEIQVSQDGQMAVRVDGQVSIYLNDGHGWEEHYPGRSVGHLFWFENQLFGVVSEDLYRFEENGWVHFLDLPNNYFQGKGWSEPYGSSRILYFHSGESLIFDGSQLIQNTEPMGLVDAFALYEGQSQVFTGSGNHLQGSGMEWEYLGKPLPNGSTSYFDLSMIVDDLGNLVFLNHSKVVSWDGVAYHEHQPENNIYRYFLQDDGKLVVFSESQVGVWSGGELRWIGYTGESPTYIRSAVWKSDSEIIVIYSDHLRKIEPDHSTITLTFQGWSPQSGANGPDQKIACTGIERLIVIDDLLVQDITPSWDSAQGALGRTSAIISDGLGGWLAFEYDRHALLKFDGEKWYDQGVNLDSYISSSGKLTNNNDGTFLLQNGGNVFLIEPGGGM